MRIGPVCVLVSTLTSKIRVVTLNLIFNSRPRCKVKETRMFLYWAAVSQGWSRQSEANSLKFTVLSDNVYQTTKKKKHHHSHHHLCATIKLCSPKHGLFSSPHSWTIKFLPRLWFRYVNVSAQIFLLISFMNEELSEISMIEFWRKFIYKFKYLDAFDCVEPCSCFSLTRCLCIKTLLFYYKSIMYTDK